MDDGRGRRLRELAPDGGRVAVLREVDVPRGRGRIVVGRRTVEERRSVPHDVQLTGCARDAPGHDRRSGGRLVYLEWPAPRQPAVRREAVEEVVVVVVHDV